MEERLWHRFYEEGIPTSIDYADTTIPQILERTAHRYGDRPALIFMNGRLTYSRLTDQVDRLATALANLGVGSGSRVAIDLPNLPQTVISYFAVLRLGAIAVMTNPLYTSRELEHQWQDAGVAAAIVLDALYERKVKPIRERLRIEHYIIASIPEYLRFPLNILARLKLKRQDPPLVARVAPAPGVHYFRRLINATAPNPPQVRIDMDDVAMLQYTGGTTGVSKGAMLTHRNMSANAQQADSWAPILEQGAETWLAVLPYFHIYGLQIAMLHPIYAGGTLILMPDPRDTAGMIKNIEKHRVTVFPGVPAMYNAINQHPNTEKADLSSIKLCNSGSAPLPVDVLERFESLTGAKISEGYGLTETSPGTHSTPLTGTRKVGSIGLPLPDTDCRIVDIDDGTTDVPQGQEGELLIKGPQVMKGYWNQNEATAAAIRDGWFYTGDLATMDEEGYFKIVGRKKDMILASGYNVYPDEVDRVLMAHPAVLECATIGVPDPKRGETVKSFVVLGEGKEATAEELIAYCRENLAAYKVPRMIEFRDSLPMSTVLKVLRRELREEELAKAEGSG